MEDIADRADLARGYFYAHHPNKEAASFSVFDRLVEDLMQRVAYQAGPWNVVRRERHSRPGSGTLHQPPTRTGPA